MEWMRLPILFYLHWHCHHFIFILDVSRGEHNLYFRFHSLPRVLLSSPAQSHAFIRYFHHKIERRVLELLLSPVVDGFVHARA